MSDFVSYVPPERPVPEWPDKTTYDAVIIGAGPNGLIAGAYLARAGMKVCVVERRYEIGGGLATEEILFPGHYSNPHAIYHMMVDYMPPMKDLGLDKHGLNFVSPNAQTAAVFDDGTSLLMCRMLEDTKDSIAKFSEKDSFTFGRVMRQWRRLVQELVAPATYLPPMAPLDLIEAMERTEIGRELLEITEKSPVEIITETFESPKVQALMLYVSCMWGLDPTDTGLGFMVPLLVDRTMHKAQCFGGSHRMAAALAREVVQNGGSVLDTAEVVDIRIEDGHVTGIDMEDGKQIDAGIVMSSLDPQTTFQKLVGEEHLDVGLKQSVAGWEWEKWSFCTTHAVLDGRPDYDTDDPWVNEAFMTVVGLSTPEDLLSFWDGVRAGRIGDRVIGHATCETIYDPTLSKVPGHEVGFLQIHAPYEIEGGWDTRTADVEELILNQWKKAAPNLDVLQSHTETPVDIERRIPNMKRGSIKHGDYNALQMGTFRPNEDCSSSRTPIDGLYVCGASTYPGGLIIGGPGYIAANIVAEDAGLDKWWTVPDYVARYRDTYMELHDVD
ncbi:MAG: NAD(P)/FAD-dependent oxidoreductase [Acidimicrobiia bacterium]